MRHRIVSLRNDQGGAAVIEFAFVAPVFCLFLMGAFDIAHTLYTTATLQGIVQKTARDSALAGSSASVIDARVRGQVTALVNNATIVFNRRFYRTFALAQQAQAETWTDSNHNGTCDNGEGYQDNNANGVWDSDGGDAGQGGAKDRTVYTVTVSYQHLFPMWKMIGLPSLQTMTARTVLENQPYGDQDSYTAPVVTRYCTP